MEAAAKTVEVLSKRILPEKPHHLSFSSTWRHRARPEDDDAAESRGAKRRFEEWQTPRLQYLTFLSEADRGILLTRSYYDMREEPLKPVPREVNALSKGASAGDKKKLSLSDYKMKKTGLAASASPPEPAIAKRKESERAAPPTGSATCTPATSHADAGSKPQQAARRSDNPTKTRDADPSSLSAKSQPNRDSIPSEHRLPPKPASLPARPPSPTGMRRVPDVDEERPPKRSRPDERRSLDDRHQRDRDDGSRCKDKAPPPFSSRDRDHRSDNRDVASVPSSKDDRGNLSSSSSLPNGKTLPRGPVNTGRNTPGGGRPRSDSVNGVRPSLAGNISSRGTPTKADGTSSTKSFVPPLLSPLHLSFDSREKEKRPRAEVEDTNTKKDKERRRHADDTDQGSALPKPKKLESTAPAARKARPTVEIPPLLSPTLPPVIEAELQRRKRATADSPEERVRCGRDAPGIKKRSATDEDVGDGVKPVSAPAKKLGHRRRLLVVLHVPKSLRCSFGRVVGQAPEPRKESHNQSERDLDRKPPRGGRNDAISTHQPQAPPARKRPISQAEGAIAAEATATKRPRSSDISGHSRLATPLTPSRKTTAMSRVSSTNSVAQTPTELVNSTPSTSVPMERRVNGSTDRVLAKGEKLEAKIVREKEMELLVVATDLKHEADEIMKKYRGSSALPMRDRPGESMVKLGFVLSLESIIAFMLGFHAQNVHRGMHKKIGETKGWETMFPLMDFLQREMRQADVSNYQPLYAMLLLLKGVAVDEIIKCYIQHDDDGSPITVEVLAAQERRKHRTWHQVHQAVGAVQNPKLRVNVQPWSTLDDVAEAALGTLRLWCAEEDVDWAQTRTLRESWPVHPLAGQATR